LPPRRDAAQPAETCLNPRREVSHPELHRFQPRLEVREPAVKDIKKALKKWNAGDKSPAGSCVTGGGVIHRIL